MQKDDFPGAGRRRCAFAHIVDGHADGWRERGHINKCLDLGVIAGLGDNGPAPGMAHQNDGARRGCDRARFSSYRNWARPIQSIAPPHPFCAGGRFRAFMAKQPGGL